MANGIQANLGEVRAAIAAAAVAAGRPADAVQLVAVSKTHPAEAVAEAYAAGQRLFGENRVQELAEKAPLLPGDIAWHLIGHLQTNKVRAAVVSAAVIHSVDSERLLRRIDAVAGELGKRQAILLQANVANEATKTGADMAELPALLELALALPNVDCRGFMTMAPLAAEGAELRGLFAALRRFRDAQAARLGVALPVLSMGMSGDFREAIAEGATWVRIGTAIFGTR